ncbi:MAG: YEATS-associated helix-containing protein [Actinomycetota bacterium]
MASELQAAFQVTPPSGAFDGHMLIIFAIMIVAGILGGIANFFLSDRHAEMGSRDWVKYPILGIVAALTVPLFLNMISSTLLEGARTKPVDFYVFAGFCLMYVVASRRMFENVALKLLAQVDQVKREMSHLKQQKQQEAATVVREEKVETPKPEVKAEPRESLSYNDVEILRALSEESFVYGNLAALCDKTGLARDFVSQRLTVMKNLGVIETRINEKNVLHWFVSPRGKQVLGDILAGQDDKKVA